MERWLHGKNESADNSMLKAVKLTTVCFITGIRTVRNSVTLP